MQAIFSTFLFSNDDKGGLEKIGHPERQHLQWETSVQMGRGRACGAPTASEMLGVAIAVE